eukprot:4554470-Amphidinium_carterae.1
MIFFGHSLQADSRLSKVNDLLPVTAPVNQMLGRKLLLLFLFIVCAFHNLQVEELSMSRGSYAFRLSSFNDTLKMLARTRSELR